MNKIINGKKYDTETAKYICYHSSWDDSVHFHQKETIYKRKTGEFFRYDEKRTTWGDIHEYASIIPLTIEETKQFIELHFGEDIELYESLFGEVEE